MKRLLVLLLGGFLYSGLCHAYDDKVCYPTSGSPNVQNFTITKALKKTENVPYTDSHPRLVDATATTGSGPTSFACECGSTPTASLLHYWSSVAMFPIAESKGNYTWQALTPYLQASVQIFINNGVGPTGTGNITVPFIGIDNKTSEPCQKKGEASSASKGTVAIRISKPIVGDAHFDGVVAKVWHYRKDNYLNQADPVESMVYLHLSLTVPDGCTLLSGSTMNIDLGLNTKQGQFTGQVYPQPPKSYTPRNVNLQFDCDFASSANFDVVLSGTVDDKGQGFATSSPDVSVIVTNASGTVLPPNAAMGSVTGGGALVNGAARTSVLSLRAYPTNSSSKPSPAAEPFDATVNIMLTYQ